MVAQAWTRRDVQLNLALDVAARDEPRLKEPHVKHMTPLSSTNISLIDNLPSWPHDLVWSPAL
jgi:hypothetical protein